MGERPGSTTNISSHDVAKLSWCKETLETCNTIIGVPINQARWAEQESGVVEAAVNVDTIGGNLNIPEAGGKRASSNHG